MHSKNMSRRLLISGRILWMVSSIILSLSSAHQATAGSRLRKVSYWCSAIHCQDCARSEVLVCSNGAASNRSGDLCGCCRSCVQIRGFGASCGSQLAVRSAPKNFGDSRSRFTVLATASCGPGLVCTNFTCERSEDEVDRVGAASVDRKGERTQSKSESPENDHSGEPDDLRTNVITVEKSREFYYRRPDHDNVDNPPLDTADAFTTRGTDPGRSTTIPWPISLTTEMLPTTGELGEVSETIESRRPNDDFGSPGHLVNVVMSGREFQLVHGREALADLELLLQSVDKTQSTSILDEFEAVLLYERFKDVLEPVNSRRKSSGPKEVIDPETGVAAAVDSQEHSEDENRSLVETVQDSGGLRVLRKFSASRSSKLPRSRTPLRIPSKFRRKRQLEDPEDEDPRGEYSEVVIYDFLNDTPRTMTDPSRRWFIAREVETTLEQRSPTAQEPDTDFAESSINIHITGIPRTTKSASELDEERASNGARNLVTSPDHDTYDDKLEVFVSDANSEFPNFSEADESQERSANLTTSPMSESYENFESQRGEADNITENDWRNSAGENLGYFGANYEFTFPESPVSMEDEDHASARRVNETVAEFRAQLNRIETRIVVIESSLYNMITKLGTNGRSGVADEELGHTIKSDSSPHSGSNAVGRRRRGRRIVSSRKEEHSGNGKSFEIEDEGVAQLIPVRANRRWRTVSWQPGQGQTRKVIESRGRRYPSLSRAPKVREEVDFVSSRKKSTQHRPPDSPHEDLIARRSGARKVFREGPPRSPGRIIQSPTFLSNVDGRPATRPGDISSRDHHSLRLAPSRSQQVVRTSNPTRSGPTERAKRKSSQDDGRGTNSKIDETPLAQESILMLETQIPKPLRPRGFKDFDDGMSVTPRLTSMPLAGSPRLSSEEDNWNWSSRDDGPSPNLFAVNVQETSSESGVSPRSRESPSTVSPPEDENPGIPDESWETVDPSYLDYPERLRGVEETEGEESPAESPTNPRRPRRGAEPRERMKRAADLSQAGRSSEAIFSRSGNSSDGGEPEVRHGSSSGRRAKRRVQMADWLRAAQEYHERLRQVRTAALGTWLASRAELDDTNPTDVKLFAREVPTYLERYRQTSSAKDEARSVEVENPQDHPSSAPEDDDSFAEFLHSQSGASRNDSKPTRDDEDVPSGESSSTARKFTIIATGNSTIRIEALPASGMEGSSEDQSAQGSSSVDRRTALPSAEDFDHMYEGVDAEDGDFDYGDPNSEPSRWLHEVDVIDAASVEIPGDGAGPAAGDELRDEEDYEVDELLGRSKRDSPLFLFRVNGEPGREVRVWPASWRDFVDRRFGTDRTGTAPKRPTKRTRVRISKTGPARNALSGTVVKNSHERDDDVSSAETGDEEAKESGSELALAGRFRDSFADRARQNKRKNAHRGNIGNYK